MTPQTLLSRLLERETITATELRAFLAELHRENIHHDLKSGMIAADTKQLRAVIREYVSTFASADGGVLIVGVRDDQTIDGCASVVVGATPIAEWAERLVTSFAADLGPLLVTQLVDVGGARVLLIAVGRSPRLVPLVEDGELRYRLRLGGQNVVVPPYLLADLFLGRRQRAHLVVGVEPKSLTHHENVFESSPHFTPKFDLALTITNESIAHAAGLRGGIIGWTRDPPPPVHIAAIGGLLRSYVSIVEPEAPLAGRVNDALAVVHFRLLFYERIHHGERVERTDIPALAMVGTSLPGFGMRGMLLHAHHRWRGALYITSEAAEPRWWQIEVDAKRGTLPSPKEEQGYFRVTITPMESRRAEVSYASISEPD